ncbi:hypothetical protein ColLi_13666 [Colletotrichum liriopes]|uniref:Uncharacterized protein n=1 Tax=Colletotrichum liriopes TaxID=708192 RepID=A0AA37H0N2_9PEZI|nr:hypothetical protein ColLi_13666 [Colletotrichum liriopes]
MERDSPTSPPEAPLTPDAPHKYWVYDTICLRIQLSEDKKAVFGCWYYSLPKDLKFKTMDGSNDAAPSPHACILNMLYHTSIILLAKPFLRSGKRAEFEAKAHQPFEQDDICRRASTACREAAEGICLLAEKYREALGSFRRSPLTATHCILSAALVILIIRPIKEGMLLENEEELNGCLQTLQELSMS